MRHGEDRGMVRLSEERTDDDWKIPAMGRRSKLPRCVWMCLYVFGVLIGVSLLFGFMEWLMTPGLDAKLAEARKAHQVLKRKPENPKAFLKNVMDVAKKKNKIGKKLYVMVVGDPSNAQAGIEGPGKSTLLHKWVYGKLGQDYVVPSKGIKKFSSGWKREASCVYEYPANSGKYRMGTRRIYDYDAHGAVVVVDVSKTDPKKPETFRNLLVDARKWRKYVRDIHYTEPVLDQDGKQMRGQDGDFLRQPINIPLYLVLHKSDLRAPLSKSEELMLYQLMTEEQEYPLMRNGYTSHHSREARGKSAYQDWFLLSSKITEGPLKDKVAEDMYSVLTEVSGFHGWQTLPPSAEITKEEL